MIRLILGLGNPGQEYENTRHNSGRMAAEYFAKKMGFSDFEYDKKSNSLISKSAQITVALPETFMNKSGQAAAKLIRPKKEMKELIVIHDDLDLLLGRFKISYGKSSGGHQAAAKRGDRVYSWQIQTIGAGNFQKSFAKNFRRT